MWQQPPHSVMATLRNASEPLGMRKRDVFVSSRITVTQTRSFKLFFGPSLGDERSLPDLHNNRLEGRPGFEGGLQEKKPLSPGQVGAALDARILMVTVFFLAVADLKKKKKKT